MKNKTLLILLSATIMLIAASVAVVRTRSAGEGVPPQGVGEALFPGLRDQINSVTRVSLAQQANVTELARTPEGAWTLANRDGYPAKFESVKDLLVSMASLTKLEPKTSDPALYSRIKVDEPNPDSIATKVVVAGEGGKEIASLIIGDYPTTGGDSRFVRPANQAQSWLAKGKISASADPMAWLDREIVRIPAEEIRAVTVTHPGGMTIRIVRELGDAGPFIIDPPLPGRRAKDAQSLNRLGGGLAYASLADVRMDDGSWADAADRVITRYETTSGFAVEVTTWTSDRGSGPENWAVFTPSVTDPGAPAAEGEPASQARSRVDEIDAKAANWAYKLDQGKFDALRMGVEQLTVEGDEPGATPLPAGPPSVLEIPPPGGGGP